MQFGGLDRGTGLVKRRPVFSSNLRSVGYDRDAQVLEIEFRSGGVYRYFGVSEEVYWELMEAGSKGRYFLDSIRDHYHYARAA